MFNLCLCIVEWRLLEGLEIVKQRLHKFWKKKNIFFSTLLLKCPENIIWLLKKFFLYSQIVSNLCFTIYRPSGNLDSTIWRHRLNISETINQHFKYILFILFLAKTYWRPGTLNITDKNGGMTYWTDLLHDDVYPFTLFIHLSNCLSVLLL